MNTSETLRQSNNVIETLQQWSKGIRISQITKLRAAALYDRCGRGIGLLVTIFSVVVGTSIFSTLLSPQDQRI